MIRPDVLFDKNHVIGQRISVQNVRDREARIKNKTRYVEKHIIIL